MRPALFLPFALVVATGCAHLSTDFTCPAKGGAEWREVRSEHFVVRTDLSSGTAQELTRELEMLHEAVRSSLFAGKLELRSVVHVVAFRSKDEYEPFAPKDAAAYYQVDPSTGPTIVLPGVFREAQRMVVAHELTHHVAARVFARQPWWYQEGLAGFMETVGASGPGSPPTVGGVPQHRLRLAYPWFGGVGEVLEGRRRDDRGYATAWALVHFLVNREPAGLGELQVRFARGQDPAAAWREVFPRWDPAAPGGAEALDAEIGRYLATGRYAYRDIHLEKAHPVVERPLAPADAHDARLSLALRSGEAPALAARKVEVEEALAEDPGNVAALALLIRERPANAAELARRAATAHPDSPRAWLLVAEYPSPPDDREAALRRAIAADPDNVAALNDLAWGLLRAGRSGEALPHARRASALAPWNAAVLDTYAGVLEDLGDCAEALATQRRAVDVLSERVPPERWTPYLEHRTRLEASCGAAKPRAGG